MSLPPVRKDPLSVIKQSRENENGLGVKLRSKVNRSTETLQREMKYGSTEELKSNGLASTVPEKNSSKVTALSEKNESSKFTEKKESSKVTTVPEKKDGSKNAISKALSKQVVTSVSKDEENATKVDAGVKKDTNGSKVNGEGQEESKKVMAKSEATPLWTAGARTTAETSQRLLVACRRADWLAVETQLRQLEKGDLLPNIADESTGFTPLMFAVRDNRMTATERLLELGVNVNARSKDGQTALLIGALNAREDVIRTLLNRKADPHISGGPKNQFPLHAVCTRPTNSALVPVQLLLRASGKEVRIKPDKDGNIPLVLAIESGNQMVCRDLLSILNREQLNFHHPVTGQTALHLVTLKREPDLLRFFIECGGDVDLQDNEGQSPLHLASAEGDDVMVKLFYQTRANPNLQDKLQRTPLHLAAERGHTGVVEFLTDKFKASVFERTKDGNTLMHVAAAAGHPSTALVFIKKGVALHMPNKEGAKCIHMAAKRGHVEVVKTLLQKGEHVDARNNENFTALHIAVQAGQTEVVETLLGYGAPVQLKAGKRDETPLHIASRTKHGEKCAEMLIKSGAEVNSVQEDGETPLHYASREGHYRTTKLLLEDGANLFLQSKIGETALHVAVKYCHYPLVKLMLEHWKKMEDKLNIIFLDQHNNEGETAVHYTAALRSSQIHRPKEDAEMMRLLLQFGGDVNKESFKLAETPVHYSSKSGNVDVLQEIMSSLSPAELQRSVNTQAKNGWSPLLYASEAGHPATVKMLLLHHARVDVFDEGGRAALHLAAEHGHADVVETLLAHKAFVNVRSKQGLTPLHAAAGNGHNAIVRQLVAKYGAVTDALTLKKQTPLHLAAEHGRLEVCNSLLEMKADANAIDNRGQTPLLLAAENDYSEVVKLFLRLKPELVTLANTSGFTCAHIAAMKGSVAVVKELMKSNRPVVTSARNKSNSTALHLAAEGGHAAVVQVLLEAGSDPTDENEKGFTALHLAAKKGHVSVLDVLRTAVSWKTFSKKTGLTALHVAANYGQTDFIREMLTQVPAAIASSVPEEDNYDDYGYTPMHLAAQNGKEDAVRLLLNSNGVQTDATTLRLGSMPLHLAAKGGHIAVAGLLLSRSTEQVHAVDSQGRTPLHMAACYGQREMVAMLLGQGADINRADKTGRTAVHYTAHKGFLDALNLLVDSGGCPVSTDQDGKVPLCLAASAGHYNVITYLLKKDHDTVSLLDDKTFLLDLMSVGKLHQNKPVREFVLVSSAPIDTAVKLAHSYRNLGVREKDRSKELENMASFCQSIASDLLSIGAANDNTAALLRAVDHRNTPFLDVLIELEQKEVIAHAAVQRYLSEIWMGSLNWKTWKIVLLFVVFVCCPVTWIACSMPIGHRLSNTPVIKYLSYLVSHIFFTVLLSFTLLNPWTPLWKSTHLVPAWHEWLLMIWLVGVCVADVTNPKDRGGLGWVKVVIMVVSACGIVCHVLAFSYREERSRLTTLYVRNQFLAFALLLSFLEFLNFLTFHHLFGPWAVIIRDLMKDLLRFLAILAIFLVGFSLHLCAIYQPVFKPPSNELESSVPPLGQEFQSPINTFEMLFYALFGLVEPDYMPPLHLSPPFAKVMVKIVFGVYMMVTVVVLINLLIAMMSNTYQRIQAQSDTEWKFGRAKLIRNMNNTSPAPSPLNLITVLPELCCRCQKSSGNSNNPRVKGDMTDSKKFKSWFGKRNGRMHKILPTGLNVSNQSLGVRTLDEVVDWSLIVTKYMTSGSTEIINEKSKKA